ncbi:hypothetical protein [Paracoccus saliphilus]|uniref:Uncharacterized protein n=1 Tax=Paracoccus saliphilus TaxID=405559 RepID=A0AA45W136_9RHOB|nr:hypothetical protein [Paracoccus saliphilus]WCR03425.1 hypothetical protein JHX88_01180 [Paracoccus saliphilus]SIS53360.1 hypothetical protein SAMN05421772_101308 [Paracoccus saliphilus]
MAHVKALPLSEPVSIDKRRMSDIVNELGERTARNVIGQSLEQLGATLTATDKALTDKDFANAVAHADVLARLAWRVGLPVLAAVAQNLGDCVEQRNHTALDAVRARLIRVGDHSLAMIRDNSEIG